MNSPESRLRIRKESDVTVVEFLDRHLLDEANIAQFSEDVGALVNDETSPKVLISFANVEHLSSAVLSALITIHNRIKSKDGQLRLSDINEQILEVFHITQLDRLFHIHKGADDALESFA